MRNVDQYGREGWHGGSGVQAEFCGFLMPLLPGKVIDEREELFDVTDIVVICDA